MANVNEIVYATNIYLTCYLFRVVICCTFKTHRTSTERIATTEKLSSVQVA